MTESMDSVERRGALRRMHDIALASPGVGAAAWRQGQLLGALQGLCQGDFSVSLPRDWEGVDGKIADAFNEIAGAHQRLAGALQRVAARVGNEGKLGQRLHFDKRDGAWGNQVDALNTMLDNLVLPLREAARVIGAVARGVLSEHMPLDFDGRPLCGEFLRNANTINTMLDQLDRFSSEVTRVAREVGTEGKLGGQAQVQGVCGVWKDLTDNVNLMIRNLKETTERNTEQAWLKTNLARLTRMPQGQRDIAAVARSLLSELAPLLASPHAVLYLMQPASAGLDARLTLMASYGYQQRKNLSQHWAIGEGVVGQAAFEKQRLMISDLPDDYVRIVSGLGMAPPRHIVVLPILFEGQVKAVIEIAAFTPFRAIHLSLLDQLAEGLGIVFNSIETAAGTETLLRQQAQQLEGKFKTQQNELQDINAELERKARQLAEQNAEVGRKNREIEVARSSLQEKAEQLALTSKYKSEFLANMSHELRTPLNSLLLVAEQLRQNRDHNLSDKQLEMVRVMHGSGRDLLHLINDILDLSKIEAGSAMLEIDDMPLARLVEDLDKSFHYLASAKGLSFVIDFAPDLPAMLRTDGQRLKQVLTNLLSNAVKFTGRGKVVLAARVAHAGWSRDMPLLAHAPLVIAFSVSDTGIGIASDKKQMIFEAFQQADASTARRYGGTGLGLAISREIARLLGGELDVTSEEGVGSTFTFYLPQQLRAPAHGTPPRHPVVASAMPAPKAAERASATPLLLIIEDDPVFARMLQALARERGFDTLVTASGEEGLTLARHGKPDAITLDLELPDIDGWLVVERLQGDPPTAGIPVHVISVRDRSEGAAGHGVASYTTKPADLGMLERVFAEVTEHMVPPVRALLLIESDMARRAAIMGVLAGPERVLEALSSAAEALQALRSRAYQGIVIDVDLPDQDGLTLLRQIRGDPAIAPIPAVLYSQHPLDPDSIARVRELNAAVGDGDHALDRLGAEVERFLRRVQAGQAAPDEALAVLRGKCVLIVDDDARNLFSLTGLLEGYAMQVNAVDNGEDALAQLDAHPCIDIVLMDIMMPDMDGYETIVRVRADPRFATLPIIALTAKAMLEDRNKCITAGASAYASKPVDVEQLLAQLCVWLAG